MQNLTHFLLAREPDYWNLLETVVNIESPTHHKVGVDLVGDALTARWTALGFEEARLREESFGDHRVLDRNGDPGLPRFLLVGHMDTVFELGSGWPFRRDEDGRAYGPGVVDMKGGLVAMIAAIEALDHVLERQPKPSVRILLNSDEEPGSPRSRELLPQVVDGCDVAFVLEPAEPDGTVVAERKGVGIFRLSFTGRSAHAGQEPELGRDANEALAWALLDAKGIASKEAGTTVNPGVISGGSVPYAVAERSVLQLDVRARSREEVERVRLELQQIVERPKVADVVAELSGGFHRPPMVRLPGAEVAIDTYTAVAAELGITAPIGMSGAASDANSLVALGIPCLDGLGPVGGRAHSTEEYLEVDTFIPRAAALAGTLARLGRLPASSFRSEKEASHA